MKDSFSRLGFFTVCAQENAVAAGCKEAYLTWYKAWAGGRGGMDRRKSEGECKMSSINLL